MIQAGDYKGATIVIPEAVVAELEAQANQGREIGFLGLAELAGPVPARCGWDHQSQIRG